MNLIQYIRKNNLFIRKSRKNKQKQQIPNILNSSCRWLLLWLVINGFIQAIATVVNALLVELAFDRFVSQTNDSGIQANVWQITLGLIASAIMIAFFKTREIIDAETIGQNYVYQVRMTLYKKLVSVSPRTLQNRSQGAVMLRFVGDLTSLRKWVSLGLARLIVGMTTAIGCLLALSFVNQTLAFTVAVVLAMGALISFNVSKRMQQAAKESRRRLSRLAGNVNEKVASIAVVQVFGQSKREQKRIAKQSDELKKAMINRATITGQLLGVTEATTMFASTATIIIGGMVVRAEGATPGTIVAAMTIVSFLVPRLRELGRVQEYWHNSRVALEKIIDFLNSPSLINEMPNAPDLRVDSGCLEFEEVSFADVLSNINAIAPAGKVITIVGPNGSGKSTLLSLATRLMDPHSGRILLDGQDLALHSLASVRKAIGIASPDLPLLRGSLRRNLLYRYPKAKEDEIKKIWNLCGIEEIIAELPEGEKTRISERGIGLSAGQRQRIALARALLGEPQILLLDEVDSNLDHQAVAVVDRILSEYKGTILIITHRRDLLERADVIWHIENGELVEVGTPQKLLNQKSYTSDLFAQDINNDIASLQTNF
jgi:ABC-type multidrug transport system fused ATPase/permease subunit